MLERIDGAFSEHHSAELRRQSAEAIAEQIIAAELLRLGCTRQDLASGRKNNPDKLAIAARLRKDTTLTIKAIAALVGLGSSKSANAKLHHWMTNHPSLPVNQSSVTARATL